MEEPARDQEAALPENARPQTQRSSIPSFLFISFLLFMLTSHNGDEFLAKHQYQDALRSLTFQLSNYTTWMNGNSTNFTVPDQDPALPPLLDAFHVQGGRLDPDLASYYSNITGFVHGRAQFHNITPSFLSNNDSLPWNSLAQNFMTGANDTEIVQRIGPWNWTASEKIALSVVEKKPLQLNGNVIEGVALVHGKIELTDVNTSEDLRLEFEGVHFISNGSIFGFVEPNGRHVDIRLLPSIVPESARNETARLIEPELSARINKLKNLIDAGVVDQDSTDSDNPSKTTCSFEFYAQINPVDVQERLMQELEDETQNPTGVWTIDPPKLSINALLTSKECGLLYEVTDTEGLRSGTFFRKVTTYAGTAAIVYLILLILFTRQTQRSRTPSGVSRVSRWTFLAQVTVDSVSFAGHITFAILAEGRPSLSLIAPAFLACILFIHEAQFSVLVSQFQIPETATSPPPEAPTAAVPHNPNSIPATGTPTTTTGTTNTLPTTTEQPPPIISLSFLSFFVQHIRSDPHARLWVTLFIFLTLIVRVILSPALSMAFVGVTYSFIWLPQIVRSVRRGRSSGLTKEYIVGTTVCRLYLAMYFLSCPKNVLDVEPRRWAHVFAAFVCLQAAIVMLQEAFGPAFFLSRHYAPVQTYDYHPPMPLPDPEAPEQSLGDCAICMDAILVGPSLRRETKSSSDEKSDWDLGATNTGTGPARRKSVGGAGGLLNAVHMGVGGATARKNYSLAPCHHLFHTECLERWLAIKNICPQCRRPLPPL